MADTERAPRIQRIQMEVFPGTELESAIDHAITLATAHRTEVNFHIKGVEYSVGRRKLQDLVRASGTLDEPAADHEPNKTPRAAGLAG